MNNYAISTAGVGESLQRSAASLSAANNTLSESVALTTAANTVVQNPEVVGTALKTMSMRLRATKTEMEDLGEDTSGAVENVSQLREQLLALTKSKVDIQLDEDSYKSSYQILLEMSKVWETMDDMSQASALELMFGKRNSNVGAAILQNGELLQKVFESAENSAGSAAEEYAKFEDSIVGGLNRLTASFEDFARDALDSETVKNVVDIANVILKVIDYSIELTDSLAGLVVPLTAIIGGVKTIKAFSVASSAAKTASALQAVATTEATVAQASYAAATAATAHTAAMQALSSTAFGIIGGVAVLGITAISKALKDSVDEYNESVEAESKAIDERNKKLEEEATATDDLKKRYTEIILSTDDMATKEKLLADVQSDLVDKFGNEAAAIDIVNGKYSDQIRYLDELRDKQKQQAINYAYDARGLGTTETKDLNRLIYQYASSAEFRDPNNPYFPEYNYDALYFGNDPEKIYEALSRLYNNETWRNNLLESTGIDEKGLKLQLSIYEDYLNDVKEINSRYATDNEAFYDKLNEAQDKYFEYLKAETPSEKADTLSELSDLKSELYILADGFDERKEDVDGFFELLDSETQSAIQSATMLNDAWQEYFDNTYKSSLSNIDKLKSAIQTLAEGNNVSSEDFWSFVALDENNVIRDIEAINGEYKLSTDELITLKDELIAKTIEQIKTDQAEAQANLDNINAQIELNQRLIESSASTHSKPSEEAVETLRSLQSEARGYETAIYKGSLAIAEMNSLLGNTVDLEKQRENLLKAQEDKIDNIIESLENEKQTLQNQLDVLNEQKEALEDILDKYELVSEVVSDFIQEQIDALEGQKSEIEDTYNAQIEKLQEANEERESAIALIEKQNALENAQNNKVRYYDKTRGYVYGVDKEQLQNAQNDLDSALSEQAIKSLEKERDERTAAFDEQIEALKDYAEMWKNVIDDIKSAGDEQLVSEVLGENWRTELSAMNTDIYNRFKADYTAYNDQLQRLTDGEITSLENAIKAKEDEIDSWNDYKEQIQNAASGIEDSLTSYESKLESVALTEQSSYSDRIANLTDFVSQYSVLMGNMSSIDTSSILDNISSNMLSALNGTRSLFGSGADLVGASQSLVFNIEKVVSESPEAFVKAMETYAKKAKIRWEVSK